MRNLQPHLRSDMTAVENALSPRRSLTPRRGKASPRATGRRILMSATSSRRTTPRTRATRAFWLRHREDQAPVEVPRRQLAGRGAQAARLRRGHPHTGRRRRLPGRLHRRYPEVDNVIVGLQTDKPLQARMMPNGGSDGRAGLQRTAMSPAIRRSEDLHQVPQDPQRRRLRPTPRR